MFGKNTNQQYFPQVPVSLQAQARAFTSDLIGNNEIQIQYPANAPVFNYGFNQNANVGFNGDPFVMVEPRKHTTTSKKDRHSKIYTSQGPRDRRVRLSIGIARKFFDLQEMLGFDKPSKTLDWLLSKSKAAIKELHLSKSTSQEEEDVSVISHASKSIGAKKANLVKESRAKARARARERTKEKMCIKQLNETIVDQLYMNHFEVPEVFRFHQKNGTVVSSTNGTVENWDYSKFVSQSNQLCAILDQHKFIN